MTTIENRSYGSDVSSYQGTNVGVYGGKFSIVKTTEGLSYQNPKALTQVSSAKNNGIIPMGYHYAHFSADSDVAVREASYALKIAENIGIPKGSYFACDWEQGSGNETRGDREANASAIVTFMDSIAVAGYKPLLYSGASLLRNNIDTGKVLAKYPDCLWVASYPISGAVSEANFGYFPSMPGVAIWQFTNNWKGLNVDGNITVKQLSVEVTASKPASQSAKTSTLEKTWTDVQGMTWHEEHGTFITGGAINLRWGATTQSTIITTLPAGSEVKYNAWARDNAGRVWLQQPRANGHDGYLVGRVGSEAWGTFK